MKTRDSVLFHPIAGNFLAWLVWFTLASLTEYVNGNFGWVDGKWPIFVGFFIATFWTVRLHAWREAHRIDRKIRINHALRFLERAILALAIGITFHFIVDGWGSTVAMVRGTACAFYLGSIFWLLFDSMLNYDRGMEIFYVSKWYRSAWLDRFFSKFDSPILWLASKILMFIFGLWLYNRSFQF